MRRRWSAHTRLTSHIEHSIMYQQTARGSNSTRGEPVLLGRNWPWEGRPAHRGELGRLGDLVAAGSLPTLAVASQVEAAGVAGHLHGRGSGKQVCEDVVGTRQEGGRREA